MTVLAIIIREKEAMNWKRNKAHKLEGLKGGKEKRYNIILVKILNMAVV